MTNDLRARLEAIKQEKNLPIAIRDVLLLAADQIELMTKQLAAAQAECERQKGVAIGYAAECEDLRDKVSDLENENDYLKSECERLRDEPEKRMSHPPGGCDHLRARCESCRWPIWTAMELAEANRDSARLYHEFHGGDTREDCSWCRAETAEHQLSESQAECERLRGEVGQHHEDCIYNDDGTYSCVYGCPVDGYIGAIALRAETAEHQLSESQAECERLEQWVNDLQSGMFINCVYCGHRYGLNTEHAATLEDEGATVSMRDALRAHIAQCPRHPLATAERQRDELMEAFEWALEELSCHVHAEGIDVFSKSKALIRRIESERAGKEGEDG